MTIHRDNRNKKILSDLVGELFGPSEYHERNFGTASSYESIPINIKEKIVFNGWDQVRGARYRQHDTNEEIISGRDSPSVRYSVGILFPEALYDNADELSEDTSNEADEFDHNYDSGDRKDKAQEELPEGRDIDGDESAHDYELSTSNQRLQSSAALSFCINEQKLNKIKIKVTGGTYKPSNVEINWIKDGNAKVSMPTWWARNSLIQEFEEFYIPNRKEPFNLDLVSSSDKNFNIEVKIYRKEVFNSKSNKKECILTAVVMNTNTGNNKNKDSLFQTYFEVLALDKDGESVISAYPENNLEDLIDDDGAMLQQMYQSKKVYAIGHGCSADWESNNKKNINKVIASFLPVHEIPSTSPDLKDDEGNYISPEMALLGSHVLEEWQKGLDQIKQVINEYESWISMQSQIKIMNATQDKMLVEYKECLNRMKDGLELLEENQEVLKVFRWTNDAMFRQQIRPKELRLSAFNKTSGISWGPYPPELSDVGKWRAFQIAFLLMNIRSIVEPENKDLRENVELIWFPTGGGKTEAYFGLAAFSILWRRLKNPEDNGTEVLMRYTLRLLTTQQYQRASSLICALDLIREENEEFLGSLRITLGLWIGADSSPNTPKAITRAWSDINKDRATNKFVINQCPWCGAEMGIPRRKREKGENPLGYAKDGSGDANRISFFCPDPKCDFSLKRKLPLFVDDVSIHEHSPTMLIGTIDKLAMLAFNSGNKNFSVFGLNSEGVQERSPPGLIIQDELHLISGPLGSIAGIWETVLEDFCTNISNRESPVKPKIICSTATIRKYKEQLLSLYGRSSSTLFPPPGLDSSDSFFGKEVQEKGTGKLYVGVLAPSIGSSVTAQTRVFTTLLQSPVALPNSEKDPWWTLMLFFNSIRELGGAETLFQTDVSDYRGAYLERHPGLTPRFPNKRVRLTGELSNDELPKALEDLLITTLDIDSKPVDVCMATNILEVGVDIPRLSLMSVVGQPKTTSTYIQATGRVGRSKDRPGLIVTIYSPAKPRDRSHFEKFRTYHETLYSQVEPTSVTPFSTAALEKALHAAFVAFMRIYGNSEVKKTPRNLVQAPELITRFKSLMKDRATFISLNQEYKDPDLLLNFNNLMDKRIAQLDRWDKENWELNLKKEGNPLIIKAGSDETFYSESSTWLTMMNMRNVDANCKLKITERYNEDGEDA